MSELEKAAWLAIEAFGFADSPEFWTGEPIDPKADAMRIWRLQCDAARALRAALAQQAEPVVDYTMLHEVAEKDGVRAALKLKDKLKQQAEPVATCFCGSPQILNTWHRKDGPCFAPRTAEPVQAEPVACFCGDPTILNVWHRKDGPCLPKAEPVTDDCTPNHFCGYRWVHKPSGELCNRCGRE